MNFICLTVDRLHRGFLGPYGNTWIETPGFDHLASESLLLDQALADSAQLSDVCSSLWAGSHVLERAGARPSPHPLEILSKHLHLTLLSDDQTLIDLPASKWFAERILGQLPESAQTAETIEQTHLAQFFGASVDTVMQLPRPFGLWLHTGSLGCLWDAPYELRARYADEEDPDPPAIVRPPQLRLAPDADPDELLGYRHAYAGQVSLLDTLLDAWLDSLREEGLLRDTVLMVLAPRGCSLGEHQLVGEPVPLPDQPGPPVPPHGELIQVPWLLRVPDGSGRAVRMQSFVQPADLMPTLFDSLGLAIPAGLRQSLRTRMQEGTDARDRVLVQAQGYQAIRTPGWYLVQPERAVDGASQLYAKPGDVWEQNEVSQRCNHVVELLGEVAQLSEQAMRSGSPMPPLDAMLVEGLM